MHKLALAVTLTSSLLFVARGADAQSNEGQGEAQPGEVRRDPNGITGISPYMEAVAKGRRAFTSGDHAGAVSAFDDAIAKDGERVLAYLLKAQTQLDKGDLAAATATADQGNGKKGTEEEQSKLIFLQAELRERNADAPDKAGEGKETAAALPTDQAELAKALSRIWDEVKAGWAAYSSFVAEHSGAPNYGASADDRKQKVDARVKREKDYGEVRARADNK